jgi:predicted DNA-binding protein (MmcQ/YjbR family)
MVEIETFRQLALSFEETTEEPHFKKQSFRVRTKIFATLDIDNQQAVVKLSEIDQAVFCSFDKAIMYPVEGTWGKQGWTIVALQKVRKEMLQDALTTSYCTVAPKKLAEQHSK